MTSPDFNYALLLRYKWRRAFRALVVGSLLLSILVALGLGFAYYLAHLPRERVTKDFSYRERVKYGASLLYESIRAEITAPQEDPVQSKLPIFQIYVSGQGVDRLNSDLPRSGKIFQNGYVRYDGKTYKAKIRYRGDSINHWAFPEKSWRVRLKKKNTYRGIRTFNLYLPRTKSQIADYLGYWMGTQTGLPTPEAFAVHLRVNRAFAGMRLFIEQIDRDFITRRRLPAGKIFEGDIDTAAVYGGKKRYSLFEDPRGWEVDYTGTSPPDDNPTKEIEELITVLREGRDSSQVLRDGLERLLDMDAVIRQMALLSVVGSIHIDNTHNQKFFFDLTTQKFTPLVWDITAYMWGPLRELDISSSHLFAALLSIPEFRARKNQYVWKWLHTELSPERLQKLIEEEEDRIEQEVEANPFKLIAERREVKILRNEEWKRGVQELIATVHARATHLISMLERNAAFMRIEPQGDTLHLSLRVDSHADFDLDRILVDLPSMSASKEVCGIREGATAKLRNGVREGQRITFSLKKTYSSLRPFIARPRPLSGYYDFTIRCRNQVFTDAMVTLEGRNAITGAPYPVVVDASKFKKGT